MKELLDKLKPGQLKPLHVRADQPRTNQHAGGTTHEATHARDEVAPAVLAVVGLCVVADGWGEILHE